MAVPSDAGSQEGAVCGLEVRETRRTQSLFRCFACEHEDNAGRKAANRILKGALESAAGPAAWVGGGNVGACQGCRFSRTQELPRGTPPGVAGRGSSALTPGRMPRGDHPSKPQLDDERKSTSTTASN